MASAKKSASAGRVIGWIAAAALLLCCGAGGGMYWIVRSADRTRRESSEGKRAEAAMASTQAARSELADAAKKAGFDSSGELVADMLSGGDRLTANINGALDLRWAAAREATAQVMTDDGARVLYRTTLALAASYADEESFLKEIRAARPKLAALPLRRPARSTSDFGYSVRTIAGRELGVLRYRNARLNLVTYYFAGEALTAIKLD